MKTCHYFPETPNHSFISITFSCDEMGIKMKNCDGLQRFLMRARKLVCCEFIACFCTCHLCIVVVLSCTLGLNTNIMLFIACGYVIYSFWCEFEFCQLWIFIFCSQGLMCVLGICHGALCYFEMPMLGSCQLQNFRSHLSTMHLFHVANLSCVSLLVKC